MRAALAAFLAVAIASMAVAPARAEIRIAIAGPMTGSLALLGAQMRAGAEAAVQIINAGGGLLGEVVTLEIANDNCSEDRATAIANQLAGAGVVLVVGHLCSAPSIAASRVYATENIIQIAPGSPDPRFTEERPGPGVFRLYGREDDQGPVAAAYLSSQPIDAVIAVVDDRSPYGRNITGEVIEALDAAGRPPDLTDFYSVADPDFAALVARLAGAAVDLVFIGGAAEDIAEFKAEMARQGLGALVMGGDTLADQSFVELAGALADGTLFTFPPDPRTNDTAAEAILAIETGGGAADGFALYAFAAVEIWAEAVLQVGTVDYAIVAGAIANEVYDTALGPVAFDAIGDMIQPVWVVYQWRDGAIERFGP